MLTTTQAAQRLDVQPVTVRSYCSRGLFPGAVRIGRDWMIPESDVATFRPPLSGWKLGRARKKVEKEAEISSSTLDIR